VLFAKKKEVKSVRKNRTGSREWSNDVTHYMIDCSCESVGAIVLSTALYLIGRTRRSYYCVTLEIYYFVVMAY